MNKLCNIIDTPLCDSLHGAQINEPYVPYHTVKTVVLILFQAAMSLGSTSLWALGLGLLDESVAPTKVPACIGVVVGSSLLGLQTGLMVGKFAYHVNAEFNLAGDIVWLGELRVLCTNYTRNVIIPRYIIRVSDEGVMRCLNSCSADLVPAVTARERAIGRRTDSTRTSRAYYWNVFFFF